MNTLLKSCYFCTTPFQIIGAISLAKKNKDSADLFIIGQFSTFKQIAEKIKEAKIFNNIITIEESEIIGGTKDIKNNFIRKLMMTFYYLKINKVCSRTLGEDILYDKMYFTSQAFVIRLFQVYLFRLNDEIKFIQFDDGVGSYFDSNLFKIGTFDRFFRKILFGNELVNYKYDKLLFQPNLDDNAINERMNSLDKMPNIKNNFEILQDLNIVFNFQESDQIKERVIIFDTLFDETYGKEGLVLWKEYLSIIRHYFENNEIIIKKHPRDNHKVDVNYRYYYKKEMPSEVLYLNMNIEQKILIAINSTAVVSPKIIMDEEPIVILLYKLIDYNYTESSPENIFFQKVKKMYNNQDRFLIPNNEQELKEILEGMV